MRPEHPRGLSNILIVGGGSAGWMTAAALSHALGPDCAITLIESKAIGTVGVGEATIPPIRRFNASIGIGEKDFVEETQGTFKLGIEFINWARKGERYFHPFGTFGADFDRVPLHHYWLQARADGDDTPFEDYCLAWAMARQGRFSVPSQDRRQVQSTFDYAYHFDATLYAAFLRRLSEKRGVQRLEGRVVDVQYDIESGDLRGVTLDDGRTVEADFFIDCSGFRGLLIEGALGAGYEDWSQWLPCNRAVAVPCEKVADPIPYTKATAHTAGWQWRIPLQHRTGNGHVHCDAYTSEDEATQILLDTLDAPATADPRTLHFKTGRRRAFWKKNCLAIGLAAGFMEPLESTSLHLVQTAITRFLALFPGRGDTSLLAAEFNRITTLEYERIRDFLILHYKATARDDTPFWRYCANMDVPDDLAYRMRLFEETGTLYSNELELFQNASWLAVLLGQDIIPQRYAALAHHRPQVQAPDKLKGLRRVIQEASAAMPSHAAFIAQHCTAPNPAEPLVAA